LHRFTALPLLAVLFAMPLYPQRVQPQTVASGQNQLDSSPALFAVMVALNAGGFNLDADSPSNSPLRREIRDFFAVQRNESLDELRRFVRDHHLRDPNAELSTYVSYALAVEGPPNFENRYPTTAMPPDVDRLYGFTAVLSNFYRDNHLYDLWKRTQPSYDHAILQLQEPIVNGVLQANAYLRNATSGYLGRRFQIYVDLFGPPNQVQTRSYVDDYFVVVTPSAELPIEAIRHAYLHYLLDPLALKFSKGLLEKRGLGDYAQGSPILEEQYKSDFILLTTECLIKAVESRIDRKPASVDQALKEGFVLTPAIAEQLAIFEKQDVAMRLFFPELIDGIDLKREAERLDHIDFAKERVARNVRKVTREIAAPEPTGIEKALADAEKAYTDRDLARAGDMFLKIVQQTEQKSVHAKAYYGLARIKVLEKDPETGDRLFRKVLELEPDPDTKSWSLLYLGRLADSQKLHDEAVEHYKAALAVEGAPESVRKAAEQGLKEAYVKK
jgi:tetratricopeptide (TPR) repeat protein